jgi:tetratricopeptide (TPR) repeat protein
MTYVRPEKHGNQPEIFANFFQGFPYILFDGGFRLTTVMLTRILIFQVLKIKIMIMIRIKKGLTKPVCRLLWFCAIVAWMTPLRASAAPSPGFVPAIIQRNYDAARRNYESNPDDYQAAWQLGRACFDRAEFSRDTAERASLANEGIAASRKALAHQPGLAPGHYYLSMNLAQLARTKLLGALPLLSEMENGWLAARTLDEKMDFAGPDRYVGLLYRDAPGWPVSLGDTRKARKHLLRAAELCPNFPENYLNLIESYLGWNEYCPADRALAKLQAIWPDAHKEFTREYWDESWKDWNQRLKKIQSRLNSRLEK